MKIAQYNPLAASEPYRVEEILATLRVDILILTGTQRVAPIDTAVVESSCMGYQLYHWGLNKKAKFSNRACGITIAVSKKTFPQRCITVHYPPPSLAGRLGMLTLRTARADLLVGGVYIAYEKLNGGPHVPQGSE